jgi:deoxyadenosine/deoxycytidine kinase
MLDKTSRYKAIANLENEIILIDRTMDEDFSVFCNVLKGYKILSDPEFILIRDVFEMLSRSWSAPDLTIYLNDTVEHCYARILNRGYPGDNKMEIGYVKKIAGEYAIWAQKLLGTTRIEVNPFELDFRLAETGKAIMEMINSVLKLNGKL